MRVLSESARADVSIEDSGLAGKDLSDGITPGESDPYSRSLSNPFRLILLRTLFSLSHATARSKPCVFSRLRTLCRHNGGSMGMTYQNPIALLLPLPSRCGRVSPLRRPIADAFPALHRSLATGHRSLPLLGSLECTLTRPLLATHLESDSCAFPGEGGSIGTSSQKLLSTCFSVCPLAGPRPSALFKPPISNLEPPEPIVRRA